MLPYGLSLPYITTFAVDLNVIGLPRRNLPVISSSPEIDFSIYALNEFATLVVNGCQNFKP
jgi:hypothetical protein